MSAEITSDVASRDWFIDILLLLESIDWHID